MNILVGSRQGVLLRLAGALFGVFGTPVAAAQSTGGRIRGTVPDPSGAALAAVSDDLTKQMPAFKMSTSSSLTEMLSQGERPR
jgi:hypothetical protein